MHTRTFAKYCRWLLLAVAPAIWAQPICKIQYFNEFAPFSQQRVIAIVQDSKGFMWFPTWNGIIKFDGYTIKQFKSVPGDETTLTSNRFIAAKVDNNDNLWCITYDTRLYLFDSETEKFIDILQSLEQSTHRTFSIRSIVTLKKGVVWAICDDIAIRIDENKQATIPTIKSKQVLQVFEDADGDEWILTKQGISIIGKKEFRSNVPFRQLFAMDSTYILITETEQVATYNTKTEMLKFEQTWQKPTTVVHNLCRLNGDSIAIATGNGLFIYSIAQSRFHPIDTQHTHKDFKAVLSVFQDSHNDLWLYSDIPGVIRANLRTGEQHFYQTPKGQLPVYSRPNRDLIFEDNQGTLWLNPHLGAFCYFDREENKLKAYYTNDNDPNSRFNPAFSNYGIDNQKNLWLIDASGLIKMSFLPHFFNIIPIDQGYETRAFLKDSNSRLWAATKKGMIRIYEPDGEMKGYLSRSGHITPKLTHFNANAYCFLQRANGDIFIGTKTDGLLKLTESGHNRYDVRTYKHDAADPYSISNNSVYQVFEDSRHRLWIATYGGGLNLVEETDSEKLRFLNHRNRLSSYPIEGFMNARCINEAAGVLMVGTTNGLLTFATDWQQPEKIDFHIHVRQPHNTNSLCNNDVRYIYNKDENTYILTYTGGLNVAKSSDLLNERINCKTYTVRNGLESDLVVSMVEDEANNLWIIAEDAVSRFNPTTETFDNYGRLYLQSILFSEASPVMLNTGKLILGTNRGIVKVNTNRLHKSNFVPPIVITNMRIQEERDVSIQFAALDYSDPSAIDYAYRMSGLEKEWNEVGNVRTASYMNLPPGEYEFQVKSTNSDGVWKDNIKSVRIVVEPTFTETIWATILYIFIMIGITATIVFIFIYIYRLRHRISMEQQLANIKLRFFTDISHELRTPLTLIASPVAEVLADDNLSPNARKLLSIVHKNTQRILNLVNQILDFRKIENHKMKVLIEQTELRGFLEGIMEQFQGVAERMHINFGLSMEQATLTVWIDRDKIEKVVYNLLSNAFKYSKDNTDISINVVTDEENLYISVADQGIGIKSEKLSHLFQRFETLVNRNILQPSSGIGLSLAHEFIELHGGEIKVESIEGVGSTFTIAIPLQRSAYETNPNVEFILNDLVANKQDSPLADNGVVENESATNTDEQLKLLIVEDNPELRDFLHTILESDGYCVSEATNGQEGFEAALHNHIDIIVTDVMMPVMDGLDMVKAIKSSNDICHIPIIVLSAKSSLDDRINGIEQGIDDYITKPFSASYLKARIRNLLQQRRRLQETYRRHMVDMTYKDSLATARPEPVNPNEEFLQKIMVIMDKQLNNSELSIDNLAEEMCLSRTILYGKMKSIMGMSPVDFIRDYRIRRAAQLIEQKVYNISEIAYMTGFNDPKYFSRSFKKVFGVTPTEWGR